MEHSIFICDRNFGSTSDIDHKANTDDQKGRGQYQKENEYELPEGCERVISDITMQETTRSRLINFVKRFHKLRLIWKKERPDLVLSCTGKNNFMTIVTTMFTGTKAVVSVVGEAKEEYPTRLMKLLANILFHFLTLYYKIYTISKYYTFNN